MIKQRTFCARTDINTKALLSCWFLCFVDFEGNFIIFHVIKHFLFAAKVGTQQLYGLFSQKTVLPPFFFLMILNKISNPTKKIAAVFKKTKIAVN